MMRSLSTAARDQLVRRSGSGRSWNRKEAADLLFGASDLVDQLLAQPDDLAQQGALVWGGDGDVGERSACGELGGASDGRGGGTWAHWRSGEGVLFGGQDADGDAGCPSGRPGEGVAGRGPASSTDQGDRCGQVLQGTDEALGVAGWTAGAQDAVPLPRGRTLDRRPCARRDRRRAGPAALVPFFTNVFDSLGALCYAEPCADAPDPEQVTQARGGPLPPGQMACGACSDGINVIQERDASNTVTDRQVHGYAAVFGVGDIALINKADGTVYAPVSDTVGTIWGLMDSSAAAANRYTYDAFGVTRSVSEAVPNRYRYGTKRLDQDSSLYHFIARQYGSQPARFRSRDRLAKRRYAYVRENPLVACDPTGLLTVLGDSNHSSVSDALRAQCYQQMVGDASGRALHTAEDMAQQIAMAEFVAEHPTYDLHGTRWLSRLASPDELSLFMSGTTG